MLTKLGFLDEGLVSKQLRLGWLLEWALTPRRLSRLEAPDDVDDLSSDRPPDFDVPWRGRDSSGSLKNVFHDSVACLPLDPSGLARRCLSASRCDLEGPDDDDELSTRASRSWPGRASLASKLDPASSAACSSA